MNADPDLKPAKKYAFDLNNSEIRVIHAALNVIAAESVKNLFDLIKPNN